jgi:hypothetical protein
MTDQQLAIAEKREITPTVWTMIMNMAPTIFKSRLFNVASPEAAAAIMLKGYELGFGLTASFDLIQVVQGHTGLSPRGAMAVLHGAPDIVKMDLTRLVDDRGNFTGYSCSMERRNGFKHTSTWTLADAANAGLVKPDSGWAKYPENMCMWRAIGFCADVVAPDITSGQTSVIKSDAVVITPTGDIVEAEVVFDPSVVTDKYTPEEILIVNMGEIPQTETQWLECQKQLIATYGAR